MFVSAAFAAEEAPHGEAVHVAFPPFDPATFLSQLVWLAIVFFVFYRVMQRVLLPRVEGLLATRSGRISGDIARAHALQTASRSAMESYEAALGAARGRAHALAAETRAALTEETDAKRRDAEAGLSERLAAAETRIAEVKDRALAEVGEIAVSTAEALVERLAGAGVSRDEIARAVAARS